MHRYYAECKKRASLVPAAAVIPALRAYIKVVAFKTPVVEIAWSGVQRGGERKEKGCNKGVTLRIHQRFERGEGRKEGRKEKACVHLFNRCIPNSQQTSLSLRPEPLSLRVQGVCVGEHPCLLFLSFFLSFSNPSGCLPCLFVTIKKLECL